MIASLLEKIRRLLSAARSRIHEALRPGVGVGFVADLFRSRVDLLAENALLRQQLIVAQRHVKRPPLRRHERVLIVGLAAIADGWRDAVILVKPETVLRWHRAGFRQLWRAKSKAKPREPRIARETIELIRRMAIENALWGAERIRGELLKVGVRASKRTIQKCMRRARGPRPWGQSWATFLQNHLRDAWACDFLQTYDVCFRPIFAFFIVDLGSREVVRVGVTREPAATWVAQQLRDATPFGAGPRFLIRDNDDKFGADFDRAAQGTSTSSARTRGSDSSFRKDLRPRRRATARSSHCRSSKGCTTTIGGQGDGPGAGSDERSSQDSVAPLRRWAQRRSPPPPRRAGLRRFGGTRRGRHGQIDEATRNGRLDRLVEADCPTTR